MPPLLGSADGIVDSVGDGDGGSEYAVGVGTGGSVSGGNGVIDTIGSPLAVTAAGTVARGDTAAGDDDGGLGAADEDSTGCDRPVSRAGAAASPEPCWEPPKPPMAPGADLAQKGVATGVPSVQPTVIANGRPRTRRPKKTDLGVSRTP